MGQTLVGWERRQKTRLWVAEICSVYRLVLSLVGEAVVEDVEPLQGVDQVDLLCKIEDKITSDSRKRKRKRQVHLQLEA